MYKSSDAKIDGNGTRWTSTVGDISRHVVNGRLVMILSHEKQMDNGRELPLTRGKIQIQSEGAEIFFRQIKIRPIDRLPTEYLNP